MGIQGSLIIIDALLLAVLYQRFLKYVCSKFGEFLTSHVLQFGYKKIISCQNAVFTMQQTVDYFTQRGSTVFISSLDALRHLTALAMLNLLTKGAK